MVSFQELWEAQALITQYQDVKRNPGSEIVLPWIRYARKSNALRSITVNRKLKFMCCVALVQTKKDVY